MSDTFTSVLELRLQETGGNSDSWGTKLNAEGLQYIEDKIVGVTAISTTGGTTTLTASQARCDIIKISGTLVSNVDIVVPNEAHSWWVWNNTVAGTQFAVGVKTASGTGTQIATVPPQTLKRCSCVASDTVLRADVESIGQIVFYADDQATPDGHFVISTTTSPVSRTGVYRDLFARYGTGFGAGDGSLTFGLPTLANFNWSGGAGSSDQPIPNVFTYIRL